MGLELGLSYSCTTTFCFDDRRRVVGIRPERVGLVRNFVIS